MWLLWVLFIAAAVLPIVGFGRLLLRAQGALNAANRKTAERGYAGPDYDEIASEHPGQPSKIREVRRDVGWDILLVGAGLTCGTVGSIWALYV